MLNSYLLPFCKMFCIFYVLFLGLSSAASVDDIAALRGSKVITLDPGDVKSFKSPNYPKDYGKKDSETWEYTCSDKKSTLELNCEFFDTQSKSKCKKADYMKVVDGTKAVLGTKCGKLDPLESIVSSDNYMKIQFKTNGDKTTKKGFSCEVKCTILTTTTTPIPTTSPKPTTITTPIPTTTPVPTLECGTHEISQGKSYPIQSPNYPNNYSKKSKCTWELTCSATDSIIELSCDSFETQNNKKCSKSDHVKVSDGSSVLGDICGKQNPFKTLVSEDNSMEIKFSTNGDKTTKKGFSCSAKCLAITTTTTEGITTTEDPADLPRLPCLCGVSTKPDTSNLHSLSNHPWTVALLDASNKHFCSGTIINTYYILTSKSCVSSKGTSFKIRFNEHELGTGLPRAITRDPTNVVMNGDLALVKIDTTVSLENYDSVKPACLPNSNTEFIGDSATHSGYDHGKCMKNDGTWDSGSSDDKLTFKPSAHSFCREDLGGPIVSSQEGKYYLTGIAIDPECGTSQDAAKVSSYFQWIMDNSNSGRFCKR